MHYTEIVLGDYPANPHHKPCTLGQLAEATMDLCLQMSQVKPRSPEEQAYIRRQAGYNLRAAIHISADWERKLGKMPGTYPSSKFANVMADLLQALLECNWGPSEITNEQRAQLEQDTRATLVSRVRG